LISKGSERTFAFEQLIGADPGCTVQQDRIFVERVRSGSGTKVLLGVVADGDGDSKAGEAAQVVIQHVVEAVRLSKEKDLNAVLIRGLQSGSQAILGGGSRVAATVLAIKGKRYHLASVGHTQAFLIHDGRAKLLNQRTDDLLGITKSPQIQTNSTKGDYLAPGDRMVMASDGLTRINPEDGRPFVNPKDLPSYVEGNSPREAARHILSIAMGRDVDDNVSVIVIQTPGGARGAGKRWLFAALPALALVIVLIILAMSPSEEVTAPELIDYGYGVILSGSAFIRAVDGESRKVDKLGTIPPRANVKAEEDTRLTLQSSFGTSSDLSAISIYLAAGSELQITSADLHLPPEAQGGGDQNLPVELSYLDGSMLVVRGSGSRIIQIKFEDEMVSLAETGRAVLGFQPADGILLVGCLQGGCTYQGQKRGITSFQSGYSLSLPISQGFDAQLEILPADTVAFWDDLCAGCLSSQ
jgi:serine/threonine protein phosphatase PrpC